MPPPGVDAHYTLTFPCKVRLRQIDSIKLSRNLERTFNKDGGGGPGVIC